MFSASLEARMKRSTWGAWGIGVWLVAGCGGAAGSSPGASKMPGAVASTAPPLPAQQGACGGFEKRAWASQPVPLLGGRLSITPLAGLAESARPSDIMSAEASVEKETRLFLADGEHKLVVFSEEMFARPGANLLESVLKNAPELREAPREALELPGGLRATLFFPKQLEASGEAVPVAFAFTVLPDDTLQATHVLINPAVVKAGSGGCRALARALLGSLRPGTKQLDLSAGRRKLADGYSVEVPASYAVTTQQGPDFTVFDVLPVKRLDEASGRLGFYFGHHPDFHPDAAAKKVPVTMLGQAATWYRSEDAQAVRQEALLSVPKGPQIHVFLGAGTGALADELARIATTLKRVP